MIKEYVLMAQSIRSGQVPAEDVCFVFDNDPLFKLWYKHNYCMKEIKNKPEKFLNV